MDENKVGECENALQRKKHEGIMLNLDQKANIFVADQTPTPTRLIKNCDEVGLFEDLQNVNPFDETFRRAVAQTNATTSTPIAPLADMVNGEDSLHTPQVFPQLESSAEMLRKPLETPPISSGVILGVPEEVDDELLTAVSGYKMHPTSRQNSQPSTYFGFGKLQKYRCTVEKAQTPTIAADNCASSVANSAAISLTPLQATATTTIQVIQPHLYALNFPTSDATNTTVEMMADTEGQSHSATTPVQTVKPFILPKVTTPQVHIEHDTPATIAVTPAKSSTDALALTALTPLPPAHANLTPSSQLPIKERLKAIINFNSKIKDNFALTPKLQKQRPKRSPLNCDRKFDDDCIERRRAASTRYRLKMRNEHKLLRQRNSELQAENEKLRQRVLQLEQQLQQQQQHNVLMPQQPQRDCNGNVVNPNVPVQLQIAPSTVHLVMNIPKLVVPANGRPLLLPAPITYNLPQ